MGLQWLVVAKQLKNSGVINITNNYQVQKQEF